MLASNVRIKSIWTHSALLVEKWLTGLPKSGWVDPPAPPVPPSLDRVSNQRLFTPGSSSMYNYLLDGQLVLNLVISWKWSTTPGNFWSKLRMEISGRLELNTYKLNSPDGSYLFHYNVIGAPLIDFTEKYGMSKLLNPLSAVQFKFTNILYHHLSFS